MILHILNYIGCVILWTCVHCLTTHIHYKYCCNCKNFMALIGLSPIRFECKALLHIMTVTTSMLEYNYILFITVACHTLKTMYKHSTKIPT